MPALQVRDFPEDLYGELRECANDECRSIANQVIYILRDYLRAYRVKQRHEAADEGAPRFVCIEPKPKAAPCRIEPVGRRDRLQCEEEERFARIEERKGLFARIHALPKFEVPDSFPGPAELVREDRDGRPSDAMLGIGA